MISGFLNILKPPGMTSHDVVGSVRRILAEKKAGHAGTLDPGAAGVLPVAVGRATRFIEYLPGGKAYRAEITLGLATDSGDDSGQVISRRDFAMPTEAAVEAALADFRGKISQLPPKYSAIKINGRRSYELARRNIAVELSPRQVEIYRLELRAMGEGKLLIEADCSKGTYMRSLCADIGRRLGIPATMSFLVRLSAGGFPLEKSLTLEELRSLGLSALSPIDAAVSHIPRYDLPPNRAKPFLNGLGTNDYRLDVPSDTPLRVYGEDRFLGIGRYRADTREVTPEKIIPD